MQFHMKYDTVLQRNVRNYICNTFAVKVGSVVQVADFNIGLVPGEILICVHRMALGGLHKI